MGPGFFIFFQKKQAEKQKDVPTEIIGTNRIKEEDEELILILQLAVTHKLI